MRLRENEKDDRKDGSINIVNLQGEVNYDGIYASEWDGSFARQGNHGVKTMDLAAEFRVRLVICLKG